MPKSEGQVHFGPAEIRGSHALRPVGARYNTDGAQPAQSPVTQPEYDP